MDNQRGCQPSDSRLNKREPPVVGRENIDQFSAEQLDISDKQVQAADPMHRLGKEQGERRQIHG